MSAVATKPFTFDERTRRFRAPSGRFIPWKEVRKALDSVVDAAQADIRKTSEALQVGSIEIGDWQASVAASVKSAHVAATLAAKGGKAQATAVDWSATANRLKFQYGKLRDFANELANDLPLDGRFLARADMYGTSATGTYEATLRRDDLASGQYDEERRQRSSKESCAGCIHQESLGWQRLGVLKDIGTQECLSACRCSFQRRRAPVPSHRDRSQVMPRVMPELIQSVAMANLTKKQRDELSESDFGDPSKRLFPITDQNDVDSAAHLIGKAGNPDAVRKRIIVIAKRKGLKVPDEWSEHAKMSDDSILVSFTWDASARRVEDGYAVYPNALIFEAGEYAEKGYSMTPEEMWAAVEGFSPVSGNINHDEFLSGRACHVRSIRLDDADPFRLRAEVAVPLGLDELLNDKERGFSCEWHPLRKQLVGAALTTRPHVTTASLIAGLAKFAVEHPESPDAELVSAFTARKRHPSLDEAMQSIHDTMALYPGGCPKVEPVAAFGDQTKQRKAVRAIHDATIEHGATCSGSKAKFGASSPGRSKMSLKEKLGRVLFGAGASEVELAPDITDDQAQAALAILVGGKTEEKAKTVDPPPSPVSFADSPEAKSLQAKIAELERKDAERTAEAERLRVEARDTKAVLFADEAKRAGVITPAIEADTATFYAQLLEDDHQKAVTVTFSDGGQQKTGGRAAAFAAFLKRLPRHGLTADLIDPTGRLKDGTNVLFNREAPDPAADGTDDASIKALMCKTERGRQQWDAAHANGK